MKNLNHPNRTAAVSSDQPQQPGSSTYARLCSPMFAYVRLCSPKNMKPTFLSILKSSILQVPSALIRVIREIRGPSLLSEFVFIRIHSSFRPIPFRRAYYKPIQTVHKPFHKPATNRPQTYTRRLQTYTNQYKPITLSAGTHRL